LVSSWFTGTIVYLAALERVTERIRKVQMDTYTKTLLTIITVCVVVVTLLLLGSLIFKEHHYEDEDDYSDVEEFHEKLEYIIHRIDGAEERFEQIELTLDKLAQ
tara:strand:+ start:262 stop:573 length:312 start_codon:yes stop_codon:yes gene_type:complete